MSASTSDRLAALRAMQVLRIKAVAERKADLDAGVARHQAIIDTLQAVVEAEKSICKPASLEVVR